VLDGVDAYDVAALLFSWIVPDPVPLPELHPLTDYRWQVKCGRCGRLSAPAKATSPENAWRALVAIGWMYVPGSEERRASALCRSCATAQAEAPPREPKKRRRPT
jgi:hypothetical protein